MESHWRSIFKSFSWRILSLFITGGVTWALTRELRLAVCLGLADACMKVGLFYAHERVWTRVRFGRGLPPEYHI